MNIKNPLIAISICCLFLTELFGEVTNGSLTTSWSYDKTYETITIRAHNSHPSKSLNITKMKIWNNSCSNISTSSTPDRIYGVNKTVSPMSDRKITVNAYLPSARKCAVISHKMVEPRVFKPTKPKPKKRKGFLFQ